MNNKKYSIEIGLILLLLFDLFFKSLSIFSIGWGVLLYIFLRSNYWENTFLLLQFYSFVIGYFFNYYGYANYGGWMLVLGAVFLLWGIIRRKVSFYSLLETIYPFVLLFVMFGLSLLTTQGGDAAVPKYITTFQTGIISLIAYIFLFSNHRRVDFIKIGIWFILFSVLLLRMGIVINGIPGPSNIWDFGFFRYQSTEVLGFEPEVYHVGYQNMGFYCVQGLGLYMVGLRKNLILRDYLIFAIVLLATFYSGSRQAILSYFIILVTWVLVSKKNGFYGRIAIPVIIMSVLYYFMQALITEGGILESLVEDGYLEGGGREAWLMSGVEQFDENQTWGVGFGRYTIFGLYGSYPHNLIIELLCETGIVGFLFVLLLSLRSVIFNTKAFLLFLYFFMALFLRSMASGGLAQTVSIFSLLFALPAMTNSIYTNSTSKKK